MDIVLFFFDGMEIIIIMFLSVSHQLYHILGHQELLQHPQNPYSIGRACHKLSKTPPHARIGAVGGPHHHVECATRALSGQGRQTGPGGPHPNFAPPPLPRSLSRYPPSSDETLRFRLLPLGPVWAEKRTCSALKVMVRATYCADPGVRRRFGKLMARPFD